MAYEKILVGTDGSSTAARAVDRALEIAAKFDAELVVLHVLDKEPEPDGDEKTDVLRSIEEGYNGSATIRPLARSGDPATVLLKIATEEKADLIVVGNRGMEMSERVLDEATELLTTLGTVPNRLSHQAGTDVLIVHTGD